MIRVGIFGAENSHAAAFTDYFNDPACPIQDIKVVALGGEDPEAVKKIQDKWGIETVVSHPSEMIGKIDAGMITSRDGSLHCGYAAPIIEAGLPVFIDKPVTSSEEDARALLALMKKHNARVIGGSSVKLVAGALELADIREKAETVYGGHVWAPVSMVNDYGNFYFYSAHLTEVALKIFGMKPEAVTAHRNAKGVSAILHYADYDVSLNYSDGYYAYGATVLTDKKPETRDLSLEGCYQLECDAFVRLVKEGKSEHTYEEILQNVFVINAVKRAFETGKTEKIVGVL